MNIRDATRLALRRGGFIRKWSRTEHYMLYVAAGSVFRFAETGAVPTAAGREVGLDAREVVADDWFVVDSAGAIIEYKGEDLSPARRERVFIDSTARYALC